MVTSHLLSGKERKEITSYLEHQTRSMPGPVRQARVTVNRIDLDLIASDLELLRRLKQLEVPMGRKRNDYREAKGVFKVRHENGGNIRAKALIKPSP